MKRIGRGTLHSAHHAAAQAADSAAPIRGSRRGVRGASMVSPGVRIAALVLLLRAASAVAHDGPVQLRLPALKTNAQRTAAVETLATQTLAVLEALDGPNAAAAGGGLLLLPQRRRSRMRKSE